MLLLTLTTALAFAAQATCSVPQVPFAVAGDNVEFNALDADFAPFPESFLDTQRLVQFSHGGKPQWITEREKIRFKASGMSFMDITDAQDLELSAARFTSRAPTGYGSPNASTIVKKIISTLSTDGPKANLEKFTSFRTRYYRSATGRDSQLWLLKRIQDLTNEYADASLRNLISITEFEHSWGQNSIVAKIKGSETPDEIVIIGAHQDSTNIFPFLPAPGADDDGSGSVTILEAYRAIVASGFQPNKTVEFHWYSAEEGGLLGSQALAKAYQKAEANVHAMIQFDMTAWVKKGSREEVGIITDFVDPELTKFNIKLVEKYLDIPHVATKCGYACSDHASWQKAGYPAAFSIESSFENSNHNIHSSNDRIDYSEEFSFDHMLEFSKLAVAFAVELSK